MLRKLEELIERVNSDYLVEYEEANMLDIKEDEAKYNRPVAFIPEFMDGKYTRQGYYAAKTLRVEISFCRFSQLELGAEGREALRNQIEQEMVLPFLAQYEQEFAHAKPTEWFFSYPAPRFDAGEVSVALQFDSTETRC